MKFQPDYTHYYTVKFAMQTHTPYQIDLLSDHFKSLAVEIGTADKYATLIFKMPIYDKFIGLTSGIQGALRYTANFWQTEVKKGLKEILDTIYYFLKLYNSHYSALERHLTTIRNSDTEKEVLIQYLNEIIASAKEVRAKILLLRMTRINVFQTIVADYYFKLKNKIIPAIQKEIQLNVSNTALTQEKLAYVKNQIEVNEKRLSDHALGMTASALSIFLGIGSMLLGGLVSGGILLIGGIAGVTAAGIISAKIESELRNLRNKEKALLEKLTKLNFDSLYLKDMEVNFNAILQQTDSIITVFNSLATAWNNILNSLQELLAKLQTLTTKLQKNTLRYIRGAFNDVHQEFLIMQEKVKRYGMLLSLPIQQADHVRQLNKKLSFNFAPYPLLENEVYFKYQPDIPIALEVANFSAK